MTIPICAVTGRIAGDADACGDCDPCGAAHMVPDAIKGVLTEKEEWRQRYGTSAAEIERLQAALVQVREVCDDNRPASCNKDMALAFVRLVASGAIGDEQTADQGGKK